MKKFWKVAGAVGLAALAAALLPYSYEKDKENDSLTIRALLWKYTNQPDPAEEGRRCVTVDLFKTPFSKDDEIDLLADDENEPIIDCTPCTCEPVCEEPVCEDGCCEDGCCEYSPE